jgi:hypothetical protein
VLNHYGGDMVNSLTNAVQFGLREAQKNGKDFQIVVPLFSRLMASGAGENVKGIFGSTNWHWSLQDAGRPGLRPLLRHQIRLPAQPGRAHLLRVQALLYADAVERAGSSSPARWSRRWKGFEFDGLGNGPTLYRADDHQCFKDVLVVKGKENPTIRVRPSGDRRSHPGRAGHLSRRITRSSPAASLAPATTAPEPEPARDHRPGAAAPGIVRPARPAAAEQRR